MRTIRVTVLAAAVVAVSCLSFVGTAGAGSPGMEPLDAPLTITKVVSGPVPAGTTFSVTVTCDNAIIEDSVDPHVATVTFNASGTPTSENVIQFGDPGTCQVTETVKGGAATTTYACEGVVDAVSGTVDASAVVIPNPCGAVTATDVTILVNSPFQAASVTVTNTFVAPEVAPEVAPAVVVAPAFTG